MPFNKEHASGESLIWLENSTAYHEFEGTVMERPRVTLPPPFLEVRRRDWVPDRVIAIDGSNITHHVRNGFPGAEASLLMISAVRIDISKLISASSREIPSPRVFREMELARTVETVLPGSNVVRESIPDDSPRRYFRSQVYSTLSGGYISEEHETLLQTLRAIAPDFTSQRDCPNENCEHRVSIPMGSGQATCSSGQGTLWETDALRLDERFNEMGSNGEVHGEFRHLLEILLLLNILRFFATRERARYLADCAFVLDGPLAMFGHIAWLKPYIVAEINRINNVVRSVTGDDMILFGIEKSGRFYDHLVDLDFDEDVGPGGKFSPGTVIAPDKHYIHRNIVFRPEDAKPHGVDEYFGRKILYKTRTSNHAVINTAMINSVSCDLERADEACYPRIGDMLDIMDHLSTYLYEDGFMPLIRAHAHAAIPLQRGADILTHLFEENEAGED